MEPSLPDCAEDFTSRLILDRIPALVVVMTTAGEVEHVNRQVLDYVGGTLDGPKGWKTNHSVHPDDRAMTIEAFEQAMGSGRPYELEHRLRRFDGEYRWFQVRGLPFRNADGQVVRWYVVLTDIEDRKRAEESLRRSEDALGKIINALPVTAWSTRPNGYCDFLNKRWLEYAGFTAEQAEGWGWGNVIHPDDASGLIEYWQRALHSGASVDVEARMRRADGVYRWFLFRANPFRDESGQIVRWYGTNIDIEDRKQAEEAARVTEERLRKIIDTLPVTAWSTRPDGYCDYLSRRWLEYAGFSAEQAIGWGWGDVIHPEDAPRLIAYWQGCLASGAPVDVEARMRRADGRYRWFLFRANPLRDDAGNIIKWYGTNIDIEDRKRADEALDKARSELAHVSRNMSLGVLTASVAHEVNQPLSGIITNAGTCVRLLTADPPNIGAALDTARRIIRDGNRAADVIARLRTLFSSNAVASDIVNLNDAAQEVLSLVATDLQRGRVIARVELDDDAPAVKGDRVQLQQVILNLVRNAADSMSGVNDRPRRLLIRTRRDDRDQVRLTVQDVGVGIVPEVAGRIFDPFYTTKTNSMGIGLSVSRLIIEGHRGRLWAEPNEGPGVAFSFSVPSCSYRTDRGK